MAKTVFVDGDPSQGIMGTIVSAEFLNKVFSHRHDGVSEDGCAPLNYAVDTGSANTYAIALTPALTAHVVGMPITFRALNANSAASTLAVNALAAVGIRRANGSALSAGDVPAGFVMVAYDGQYYRLLTSVQTAVAAAARVVEVALCDNIALTVGLTAYFRVPSVMNGWKLTGVAAMCKVASSSGNPAFTVKRGATSMLSTNLTIDAGEYDSSTAATPAVINASTNTVATGEQIEIACSVAGTGVTYAVVELTFTEA